MKRRLISFIVGLSYASILVYHLGAIRCYGPSFANWMYDTAFLVLLTYCVSSFIQTLILSFQIKRIAKKYKN